MSNIQLVCVTQRDREPVALQVDPQIRLDSAKVVNSAVHIGGFVRPVYGSGTIFVQDATSPAMNLPLTVI